MKDSTAIMLAVALGTAFAVAQSLPMLGAYSHGNWGATGWQNGQFYGGMVNMMTTQGQTIPVGQAIQMMKDIPQYASVIQSNNTIVFKSQDIRMVVLATDHEGASNLTASAPPSYATGDAFVIYGLVDPTLVVPSGAGLQVITINLDRDMDHNFAVSSLGPPYPYMAMQGMMNWRQQQGPWMMMVPFLPPADHDQGVVHEYSYTMTLNGQANFWYLCTYPGHAGEGMYGEILVGA